MRETTMHEYTRMEALLLVKLIPDVITQYQITSTPQRL